MTKQYDLDINKVFFYESHRKKIISELKKRHNLKLNDILFYIILRQLKVAVFPYIKLNNPSILVSWKYINH